MLVARIQYPINPLGRTIRVVQWGLEGPAVLLVHGLGSRAESWQRFAPLVAGCGFRCFAIDLPGHGLSWKGSDFDYSATGHATLLEAICDQLGEARIDLVASSLGGLHAAAFAVRAPGRLRSLTLIGSIGLKTMAAERCDWTASYLADTSREAISQRFARSVFDPTLFDDAYIEESYRMNNSAGAAAAWSAIAHYYRTGINADVQLAGLARLNGSLPILLLWGKDDPTVPYDIGLEAVATLPGAMLCGIADTRHVPQVERPRLSAEQVLRLLRREPGFRLPDPAGSAGAEPPIETLRYEDVAPRRI
jgi:pyruvate dehydrogenase E2 component (dihydrolipoamide acetyltransferase)